MPAAIRQDQRQVAGDERGEGDRMHDVIGTVTQHRPQVQPREATPDPLMAEIPGW
ncbi:hypothetical protein [Mycobacterium simiae]|uniref:hypothetical protein n=1 Tax=Mycobacterium simiae TaxID=1784 RepID=UPI00165F14D9|nr:hypothetical protein [Mycobacterium simiae]